MTGSKNPPSKPLQASDDAVQVAVVKLRLRGAQITPLREAVFRALWLANGPVGAYYLRGELSKVLERNISATSIYRTLDFLCKHGAVVRIESLNAYVACERLEHKQGCILFVCNVCGLPSEIQNQKLGSILAADAEALGFTIDHHVIELSGSCADCRMPVG